MSPPTRNTGAGSRIGSKTGGTITNKILIPEPPATSAASTFVSPICHVGDTLRPPQNLIGIDQWRFQTETGHSLGQSNDTIRPEGIAGEAVAAAPIQFPIQFSSTTLASTGDNGPQWKMGLHTRVYLTLVPTNLAIRSARGMPRNAVISSHDRVPIFGR